MFSKIGNTINKMTAKQMLIAGMLTGTAITTTIASIAGLILLVHIHRAIEIAQVCATYPIHTFLFGC